MIGANKLVAIGRVKISAHLTACKFHLIASIFPYAYAQVAKPVKVRCTRIIQKNSLNFSVCRFRNL